LNYKKIVSVVLTVSLFSLFFYYIDFKQLLIMFSKLSWTTIIIAAGMYFLSNYFRAERFRVLSDKHISLVKMLHIVFLYGFYNKMLPLRTGELSYVFLMKNSNKSSYMESLSALLITRIYDIISAFLLLSIALLFAHDALVIFNPALIFSFLLGAVVILFNLPGVIKIIKAVFNKTLTSGRFAVNPDKRKLYNDRMAYLYEWFTKTNKLVTSLKLTGLSVLIWLSLYGTFYVLINQLGSHLPYSIVIIGSVFANFSNLLPVSGIGGFGTMEAGWAIGFTILGVKRNDAIASGIVVNLFIFFCTVGFALVSFIAFAYTKRHLYNFKKGDD